MTPDQRAEFRRLAEAALAGAPLCKGAVSARGNNLCVESHGIISRFVKDGRCDYCRHKPAHDLAAAANPTTILVLLDRLDELEETLGRCAERLEESNMRIDQEIATRARALLAIPTTSYQETK